MVTPAQLQAAQPQRHPEAPKEGQDIRMLRIVIEDLVQEPFEGTVVNNGQDAERTVVQLIGRDIPGKIRQGPVEIGRPHLAGRLFSPPASTQFWMVAKGTKTR